MSREEHLKQEIVRDLMRILGEIKDLGVKIPGEPKHCTQLRYQRRNLLVQCAIQTALCVGYKAGYTVHAPIEDLIGGAKYLSPKQVEEGVPCCSDPKWEPQWGVVAIVELPTGQVSWHLDSGGLEYDGHTDKQKWDRVHNYLMGGESKNVELA